MRSSPLLFIFGSLACLGTTAQASTSGSNSESAIAEIVVTADLREASQIDIPASVSIYDQEQLQRQSISHLEQVLGQAPNVNFASGASRGRFIQIRGIGERSEFIEPVNYSVGVLVDGIDFTGISTAITSLDVNQIEILRGPQGTVYGANALAGLINVNSNPVVEQFEAEFKGQLGEYNTANFSGFVNLPMNDQLGLRLAAQQNNSDGYRDNTFLHRDDTNNIDETNLRANLQWQPTDTLDINWITFYANVDNGYDGFSLDNTRDTYSDQPGTDAQETIATAITGRYTLADDSRLITTLSSADSDLEYSYDEDWVYVGFCENTACDSDLWGFDWEYSSFDQYFRNNKNNSVDVRWVSAPSSIEWVVGAYYRDQSVELERIYTYAENNFTSEYNTQNLAFYGEMDSDLSDALVLSLGLRWENRDADYLDNTGVVLTADEDAMGGKLALRYQLSDSHSIYGIVSRGYQFGGFNPNDAIAPALRRYDSEFLTNYEIGFKGSFANGKVYSQLALFWQDRDDVQINTSNVSCPPQGFPCTFDDYLDNASEGTTYGLEAQLDAQLNDRVTLYGGLGLMRSEFKDYISFNHVDADPENNIGVDLDGHDLPQAPHYSFTLGTQILLANNLLFDVSIIGKDKFYYSNDHEYTSKAYELVNARLVYNLNQWQFGIWGRNLGNKDYYVRGFGTFSNDPRDLYAEPELYVQYGEPRVLGVSVEYAFN